MKKALYSILVMIASLAIATSAFADPPINDDCDYATDAGTLTDGVMVPLSGSVTDATNDCEMVGNDEVWIKFTLSDCMNVTIDFCDDENIVSASITDLYEGCPCEGSYSTTSSDICENENISLTWSGLTAGTYYYPIVASYLSAETYTINVTGNNCAAPENDNCADAVAVNEVTDLNFTTIGASFDGEGTCMTSPNTWYVYTPTFTGDARITINPDYSSRLAVYDGDSCSPLPSQLGCTTASQFDFAVVSGEQYLIEVGGRNSASGSGTLTIAQAPQAAANDNCENATDAGTLASGTTMQFSGNVYGATQDCENTYSAEVWIKFTLANSMNVTIDYCDDENMLSEEVEAHLYDECPCGEGYAAYSQEYCENYNPSFTWYNLAAGTYYYPIETIFLDAETYTVNILGIDCTPPENDNCSDAAAVGEATSLEFTTQGASFDGEGTCMTSPNIWYVYTPTFTGEARVTVYSDYSDKIAVYDGFTCSSLPTELGCTTDSRLDFNVVSGQQYLIEIGGEDSELGSGTLTIGAAPPPLTNDDCVDALDAGTLDTDVSVQVTGNNEGATQDCDRLDYAEVWVKFTIEETLDVTLDFCGTYPSISMYGVYWSLFNDCPCDSADRISHSNSEYCEDGNFSMTWLDLPVGTYYYPIISGQLDGDYVINIIGVSPFIGACCFEDGFSCENTDETTCIEEYEGTWMGARTSCGEYDEETGYEGCYQPSTGACCYNEGYSCVETDEATCSGELEGTWKGEGTECGEYDEETGYEGCNQQPTTGACCYDDGFSCVETDEATCNGELEGTWKGEGTECGEYDEETGYEGCQQGTSYEYLPGDANMAAEAWPAQTIGGDVTYLVNYFRGQSESCILGGFYCSGDANGDCLVVGGDVTYLVNYFRGLADMSYCSDYEPSWPTPSEVPTDAPDGWPNCD